MKAIDKMRVIVQWMDVHVEYFNERVATVSDIEKLYDYAMINDLEFLDPDFLNYLTEEQQDLHVKAIHNLLGYKIYNL